MFNAGWSVGRSSICPVDVIGFALVPSSADNVTIAAAPPSTSRATEWNLMTCLKLTYHVLALLVIFTCHDSIYPFISGRGWDIFVSGHLLL